MKKSAYSAAAVTVLGAGVGLAEIVSSDPTVVYKARFKNKYVNNATDNKVYTLYEEAEAAGNEYRRLYAIHNLVQDRKKTGKKSEYTKECDVYTPDPPTNFDLQVFPSGGGFIFRLSSSGAGYFTLEYLKKP